MSMTYFRETTLGTAQRADQQLHVTVAEHRHVDALVGVRHDVGEYVDLIRLRKNECFGFGTWLFVGGWLLLGVGCWL